MHLLSKYTKEFWSLKWKLLHGKAFDKLVIFPFLTPRIRLSYCSCCSCVTKKSYLMQTQTNRGSHGQSQGGPKSQLEVRARRFDRLLVIYIKETWRWYKCVCSSTRMINLTNGKELVYKKWICFQILSNRKWEIRYFYMH